MTTETRDKGEIVFDEMSARQLADIVRVIARDRGVQAAAVTVCFDEDANSVRFVVCAPMALSEAEFAAKMAGLVVEKMNALGKQAK